MGSYYNGFQIDEDKYKNNANIFKRRGKTKRKDAKTEDFWDNFEYWITYYRQNPHRFCVEFLGINLHWWQQIILYMFWHTGNSIFLASRGSGKTYLLMVYCIAKCILYPGTVVRVAAANKKQSALLLAKVKEIQRNCPLVQREISDISIGKEDAKIEFHGGSEVGTVVAGDGARGERCQIFIVDERVLVDKEIIDKVFIPFLTATRQPPYLKYKQYEHLKELETNHFIQLSSIGSKSDTLYKEFEQYLQFIKEGSPDYCAFSIPYQFAMKTGVISKKTIEKMVKESTTSIEAFKQEMEVIPSGDGEASMFKFEDLNKSRKLHVPLYPTTDEEYIQYKGNITKYPYYQKKELTEVRLVSMDLALMQGRRNDLTVFTVFRLTPNGDEYIKEVAYIETMSGANIEPQILRFKQLFYDLECDYSCLDAGGVGMPLFDLLTKKTFDPIRNKWYPAWKSRINTDKFDVRILDPDAVPVLFPLKVAGAGALELQATMITKARLNLERRKVYMLLHEDNIVDELHKRYNFHILKSSNDQYEKELAQRLIMPFIQTTQLIEEAVHTQVTKTPSGGLKIDEKTGRKDRLMSFLYGMHFIDLLEQDLVEVEDSFDWTKIISKTSGNSKSSNSFFNGSFNGFGNRTSNNHFRR